VIVFFLFCFRCCISNYWYCWQPAPAATAGGTSNKKRAVHWLLSRDFAILFRDLQYVLRFHNTVVRVTNTFSRLYVQYCLEICNTVSRFCSLEIQQGTVSRLYNNVLRFTILSRDSATLILRLCNTVARSWT
jgi:hypothetical protein